MTSENSIVSRVLVVDDDPAFCRLVERALEPFGISCLCLRTGEEALKLISSEPPRALITDGLLPGIRGDELALRFRNAFPRSLPIVFVSAFFRDMKSRLHLTNVCQVDMVLHKPLGLEDLRRSLMRIPALAPRALPALETPVQQHELDVATGDELIAEYLAAANERVATMRTTLEGMASVQNQTALKALRMEAHRFRGSGSSFGLPEVSRLGAQIEDLLTGEPEEGISQAARARLTGLIEALATKIARASTGTPAGDHAAAERPSLRLMLVDGPGDLALSCSEAAAQGMPIRLVEPAEAEKAVLADPPDAVFVAADRPEFDGLAMAEALCRAGVHPVLVMAKRATLQDRLDAQALGIEGYLHRLPDAAALWRVAAEYSRDEFGGKVLAVDADHLVLGELAEALAPGGIDVEPCPDPAQFFELLASSYPSLVTVAEELPGMSGLGLVRALRTDAKYRRLPVIVLSKAVDKSSRLAAFAAGADDVMALPLVPEELAARASVLMERYSHETRIAVTDGLTGTFRTSYLLESCDRALHLARRGRPLAMMVFDADVVAARQAVGALAAEEAVTMLSARLLHAFRVSDVVARIGDGRFAVLLHDVTKEDAARLLQSNLEALRPSAFSAGVPARVRAAMATFPEVGGGAEALLATAVRRLADSA